MCKETKRQIIESTRKKVASQYNRQVRLLKDENEHLRKYIHTLEKELNTSLRLTNQLDEQVVSQQDWIERLLEYMDMSPRERDVHIALVRADKEHKERMNDVLHSVSYLFHL